MSHYVAALDQGTTSTRCILFDREGRIVASEAREHEQRYPQPGWVEHDAKEIWFRADQVIGLALQSAEATAADVAALGVTNQRETTVVWDTRTGEPVTGAIVWQDTRTADLCDRLAAGAPLTARRAGDAPRTRLAAGLQRISGRLRGVPTPAGQDRFRRVTGLPIAPYFSATKLRWILDEFPELLPRAEAGEVAFGTIDTWLLWNLTGGARGTADGPALHITDVTNASRTMLMDLRTLDWDTAILAELGIPRAMLPEIVPSSQVYGRVAGGPLSGVPIAGILGDQQAATFGQTCFEPGEAKNTYGTGNFLLMNTGTEPVASRSGLVTTVGYQLDGESPVYCLEGSIAITGSLVQWMRDNLGLITGSGEIEALARTVDDNGGCYFVPAFSGLYAPHWRSDARGVIAGLTHFVKSGHIARAVLEATAFQSREVVDAMNRDSGVALQALKVDGGMTVNDTLMQFQADVLGVPVIRPVVTETTALGAAYAAGLATGFWASKAELCTHWKEDRRWLPQMDRSEREERFGYWKKAVQRTFDWVG